MTKQPKPVAPEVDLDELQALLVDAAGIAFQRNDEYVDVCRRIVDLIAETRAHRAKAAQLETCK